MKCSSLLLSCIITIIFVGCSRGKSDKTNETEITDTNISYFKDSIDFKDSLEFWTDDTIVNKNPRLVRLLDPLYQYTHKELFQNDLNSSIKWMMNYRKSLCDYYKDTRQSDNIPEFAMADSIMSEAYILWDSCHEDSTMGRIISYDTSHTFLIFQHYNEYDKLNSICEIKEQRDILLVEFDKWIKLEQLFYRIYSNCVDLYFGGGSLSHQIKTSGAIAITEAHYNLYHREYTIQSNDIDGLQDYGTFIKPAQNLLIDCCIQAVKEYNNPSESNVGYGKLYNNTVSMLSKLPKQIDDWCNARQLWENEMCTDFLRPIYQRNTAEILIKLSQIISSIQ